MRYPLRCISTVKMLYYSSNTKGDSRCLQRYVQNVENLKKSKSSLRRGRSVENAFTKAESTTKTTKSSTEYVSTAETLERSGSTYGDTGASKDAALALLRRRNGGSQRTTSLLITGGATARSIFHGSVCGAAATKRTILPTHDTEAGASQSQTGGSVRTVLSISSKIWVENQLRLIRLIVLMAMAIIPQKTAYGLQSQSRPGTVDLARGGKPLMNSCRKVNNVL